MLKSILSQALAMAFVISFNYALSMMLDHKYISCWWGVVALWILIDGEGIYNDLKNLTILHDDLVRKYQEIYLDNKQMMKQKYEQCHNLTNIISENNRLLQEIKNRFQQEMGTNPSPLIQASSTRTLHLHSKNRLGLMGKSGIFQ